ncbi:MAG: hypothetical protein AAGJ93_10220 [Bacteroidota bacterium]
MRTIFLLSLFVGLLLHTSCFAQNNKLEGPLQQFVNTSFMLKFKDVKIEAEAAVRRFKAESHALDPLAVQQVQTGYEQSAYRFNQLLYGIKGDFLNNKKVKYIAEFPDDYLRSLELELHQLTEFYSMHFLQPLADANEEQLDGSAAILLVVELVGLTKGLFDYFSRVRQHSRQFNENYLQQHLIQPFQFKSWDQIGAEGSMMPSPAQDVYMPDMMEAPSLDPLLQETTNLLMPNTGFEDDPYQSADTYDEWLDQSDEYYDEDGSATDSIITPDSTQLIIIPDTQPKKPATVPTTTKKKDHRR